MELLFAALGGTLLGFIFHFALPGQETRGVLWAAGFATCAAIVMWEVLIWVGMTPADGWIWVIDLVVAALTAIGITRITTVRRREADRVLLESLMGGSAA
ncbi:hypothetical protein AX769_09175 [Frondihabitans sp. PAMC 28766]|uniref:hypothetical protein n=1 Tax=Frondihabitans sp. PAMC 28766 TaxID=1795630 RepID=UPI00078B6588|nr:hypothetical protein [Frondihabitans sp. PAMC 28766]AMM20302.1 hypothetical protein AX769_09175 [Frondihabitans sp. PAMC 28766]